VVKPNFEAEARVIEKDVVCEWPVAREDDVLWCANGVYEVVDFYGERIV
jgi:hypothetical protein